MKKLLLSTALIAAGITAHAETLLDIDMSADPLGRLKDKISGTLIPIQGNFQPENIPGAQGQALRLDGYSSFAQAEISNKDASPSAMTFQLWVAPETYPIVRHDQASSEKITMAGTLDDNAHTGWAFSLGYTGKYAFECYSAGWKVAVEATDLLPRYQWSLLVAQVDGANKKVTLLRNGQKVGEGKCMNTLSLGEKSTLTIGKTATDIRNGEFLTSTFNGLVDDLKAFSSIETPDPTAENEADLSIPQSRFEADLLRPRFHGMPAANWTNECHGMTYSDGRFHLFFQKNANGPYMSRLHWGHISSPDLLTWQEEKIAIAPENDYDVKGCWSGHVFSHPSVNGGKITAVYTAVDYAKASIALATPKSNDLIEWTKQTSNPIIPSRPAGLSDDFRDPSFFTAGGEAYIIVGSSANNAGVCTLHKYNPSTGSWSNDGKFFAKATNSAEQGRFWEMPNVTHMGAGKYLFTITPLETSTGVHTLYNVGTINSDGTFKAERPAYQNIELISRDGYGLLSPTVYQHEGKTIALGIVPDKLPGGENHRLGWAHAYSLPREWSLDSDGSLIQKPYEGLQALRSKNAFNADGSLISDALPMGDVKGRRVELLGNFEVGDSTFGFRFFKGATGFGTLSYNPANGELKIDLTGLERLHNDDWSYRGVYSCTLPVKPAKGELLTLNLFIDGSMLDIFVAGKWATSIRAFPTAADADGVEAFSTGTPVKAPVLRAWTLESNSAGIESIPASPDASSSVTVVGLDGTILQTAPDYETATTGLQPGLYIIGGRKTMIR